MPEPELLVICPTLWRPANVTRLEQSFRETSTGRAELVFNRRDATCTEKVNELATSERWRDVPNYMFVGDDHVFATPGWDIALTAPLRDRPGITFPATDRYGHPQVFAISASIVHALGWMMLPTQRHYYVDDAILELGARAGCITYMPDVQVPHLHWRLTGGQPDKVYQRAERWLDGDREAYWDWLRIGADHDVETVKKVVHGG
jgi:hypothetical protein